MADDANYGEAQEKLRRKYGEEPDDDLHIEAPRGLPEVNPEIYRDVEPMLFHGFLNLSAEINEVPFVFKSINHHEFEALSLMIPNGGRRKDLKKFYSYFLAYGVYMVDGTNVLRDRERLLPEIIDTFDSLNEALINKIVRHLSEVNRRASRAVTLTEAFSMENLSRLRWAQYRNTDLTGTGVSGIEGTSKLGMNWAQLTWRALNYYEDMKEQAEREWENAKFVASAMAGKGMSRVHGQDRRRRQTEREERIERRDKIIRFALLGESMESGQNKNAPVQVARTAEELATQLENDLKGEKDFHDLVVDAYERRAYEERQSRVQRLQEMQRSFDAEFGPRHVVGATNMQGLTPEEVRFQVDRRRQLAAQRLSAQQVHPELMDPKVGAFTDKWDSIARTNRDPSEVKLAPTSNRTPGVPFRITPPKK